MRRSAVALKTASAKTQDALLSAISKRAAETVKEEISFLGPVKKRDIEAPNCGSSKGPSTRNRRRNRPQQCNSNSRDELLV